MPRLPLFSAYHASHLRSGDRSATSFVEPLLSSNEQGYDDTNIAGSGQSKKKAFHVRIQVKSSDNFSNDGGIETPVEDPLVFIYNNRWLSPTNPGAKVFIYFMHTIDFAFGSVLIITSLQRIHDDYDYGYLLSSLTAGLLLLSGSIAGFCLQSPLGTIFFDSNEARRSLVVFNTAFALIALGVYYIVSNKLIEWSTLSFTFLHFVIRICSWRCH